MKLFSIVVANYVSGNAVNLLPCNFSTKLNHCENIAKWAKSGENK
ncbi:Uncharacterised protein [uncultured archaeon]|nr:Uncharacterised protein [uncultured archaeon]